MSRISMSILSLLVMLLAGCAKEPRQSRVVTEPPPPALPAPLPSSPYVDRQSLDRVEVTGSRMATVAGEAAYHPPYPVQDRETYAHFDDNPVRRVEEHPVSTFSVDVDTGSYSNVRRMLNQGRLPPADAVRAEEMINYFDYGYAAPASVDAPFSITTEIAPAPWHAGRHLLLVGLKGYEVPVAQIPAANLVYLIDTSGSMAGPDRIDLLKQSLRLMTRQLRPQDRVAIVTYAGMAGVLLPSTAGDRQADILAALDTLVARGSTHGSAGLALAYEIARQHFIENGVNRVILASDGDFNVGTVDVEALKTMVADQRRSGVGLTVLGFGGGNYNDQLAEQLANNGNGNYHYIDTLSEGRKVLVEQLAATVLTIAEDVKIQIEFNPAVVEEYRLIGYENRLLQREDFNNDQVDAGEIGAGHSVTALYEIVLVGSGAAASDPLRYGRGAAAGTDADELAFLRLRYKAPGEGESRLLEQPLLRESIADGASERLRFAAAVAGFADVLRGGRHLGGWTMADVSRLAASARGTDSHGYRGEFQGLIELAGSLSSPRDPALGIAD